MRVHTDMLDASVTQLFNSDKKEEDFEGFVDEKLIKWVLHVPFVCLQLAVYSFNAIALELLINFIVPAFHNYECY